MLVPDPDPLAALRRFRIDLYACFDRRADALFELTDAVLTAGLVSSPVHLSLAPAHRRGWGSLYAALAKGRLDAAALRALLARHPPPDGRPIYAVDLSVWMRDDANTSPARAFYHRPSRHSAGQPIVAGWAYQWVAQLGPFSSSWTAPRDVRRVRPAENAHDVAVEQMRQIVREQPADAPVPLFVFDAGYDPVQLAVGLGDARAAILVRLRKGRCFYYDPDPAQAKPTGRPKRHGHKLACDDPPTWPEPTADYTAEDRQYGAVRVRTWAGVHAKTQEHLGRGSRRPRPIVKGTLVLVEVSRLPRETRKPQVLWLWCSGPLEPDPALLWRAYVRRFDLEHTLRFCKQYLHWEAPRPRHPEQADRWTWLVVAAFTQLRLARDLVADRRLPWERPLAVTRLTPYRTLRAFPSLLAALGTPADPPKPCGRSPGRPKGRRSAPAMRHPAVGRAA